MFRTSDGMIIKSIALSARLELCIQTYLKTTRPTIPKLNEPGEKTVRVSLLKAIKTPIVFCAGVPFDYHKYGVPPGRHVYVGERVEELGIYLKKRVLKSAHKIALGYGLKSISFRLVLDRFGMPREAREVAL